MGGKKKSKPGMSSLIMAPTAKMEGVRGEWDEIVNFPFAFPPFFFFLMQAKVSAPFIAPQSSP